MKYLFILFLLFGCATPKYEIDPETGIRYYFSNKRFSTGYSGCPEARDIDVGSPKDTVKQINAPFIAGDMVILDKLFGNEIGGGIFNVQKCKPNNSCNSGWFVYIKTYKYPICSSWFKKIYANTWKIN
jgi:hypothetical protein